MGGGGAKKGKSVGFTVPTLQSRNCRVAILLQTKSAVLFSVVVEPRKAATDKKRLSGQAREAKENEGARQGDGEERVGGDESVA